MGPCVALASPSLGKLKPKRLFVGAPGNSPEHSSSDFGVLPEQGATGDQLPSGGHKSIPRQGQTQGACSSMVSQGQVFPTCSSHGSLPKHAPGSNVTTNNLDFNQEMAHPLLCPTYGPAEEKTQGNLDCTQGPTEQGRPHGLLSRTPHHHKMGQAGFPPDTQAPQNSLGEISAPQPLN